MVQEVAVTTDARVVSLVRQANIPPRFVYAGGADEARIKKTMAASTPKDFLKTYFQMFMQGNFIVTQDPAKAVEIRDHVGKGLWLTTPDDRGHFYAATLLQTALVLGAAKSGLYLTVNDLVEAESPNADERLGDHRWVDLMVIQDVGTHHQSASGWSDNLISGVLSRRYDRGLPTVISTPVARSLSGLPDDYQMRSAFSEVTWTKE
jgi:DNA replication protein DnaC